MATWYLETGYLWWNVVGLSAIKATLILFLAALLVWRMRDRSPAARCWVWGGGLAAAAAMPILGALTPNWEILPSWMDPNNLTPSLEASGGDYSFLSLAPLMLSGLTAVFAAVWLVGVVALATRSLFAAALLRRISNSSEVLPSAHPLVQCCRKIQRELGLPGLITVLHSQQDVIPMTWGLLRTRLLLPRSAESWSEQRIRAVILHELGHVRRRDGLGQLLVQWVSACYWFHPLVWWACEQLRYEREAACDDVVLSAGVLATDYAESLLDLSHPMSNAWRAPLLAVAMAEPKALESRIREILSANRRRSNLPLFQRGMAAAMILVSMMALAVLSPSATSPLGVTRQAQTPMPSVERRFAEPARSTTLEDAELSPFIEPEEMDATQKVAAVSIRTEPLSIGRSPSFREETLLIHLDNERARALLNEFIEPSSGWRDLDRLPQPTRRSPRTFGGLVPPREVGPNGSSQPRQDPLDTRDRVSQASPRGPNTLATRSPMTL